MSTKILLLEDDPLFGESIQDFLEDEGYEITLCPNGQEALDATYKEKFDLYLLDINVPLIDGLSLLKELRNAQDNTPAIYLTSHTEKDVLSEAYENGADDYLKKPFEIDELALRIKALLRRVKKISDTLRVGGLCLDELHKSFFLNDKEILLSMKEFQLISLLMRHAGGIVTKEMIMNELWSPSENVSEGAIRVYINRLKQEIGSDKIVNIRGMGYRLVP